MEHNLSAMLTRAQSRYWMNCFCGVYFVMDEWKSIYSSANASSALWFLRWKQQQEK